jgi:T3SS (YopN, CesT) and YbjN peptide-binding chaperone 1
MPGRLDELSQALEAMGLEPELVEEDGGLLAACGETILHVQCLGADEAPYVRARNLILADVMGTVEIYEALARENVSAPAGAFVHEPQGGVIRLGGVFPDTPEYRSAVPSVLWALADRGEHIHAELRERLGGCTWAEAWREDNDLGEIPPELPIPLDRPFEGVPMPVNEARLALDRLMPELWDEDECIRLGQGHHALRTGDATHEVTVLPRPYRTTIRVLTRLVGDIGDTAALAQEINGWNDGQGFAAFAYDEGEGMLVCSSLLPGTLLTAPALGPLLRLHATLASERGESVLTTLGGRPALEVQADR